MVSAAASCDRACASRVGSAGRIALGSRSLRDSSWIRESGWLAHSLDFRIVARSARRTSHVPAAARRTAVLWRNPRAHRRHVLFADRELVLRCIVCRGPNKAAFLGIALTVAAFMGAPAHKSRSGLAHYRHRAADDVRRGVHAAFHAHGEPSIGARLAR
jgi:hypothetical protein